MMLILTTTVVLVLCLQYAACVGVYHANERRAMVELLFTSSRARTILKISSWCLMIFSVFLSSSLQGWERGVPVWLCLIAISGFGSLYVSAYKPKQHAKSGIVAVAISALLSIGLLLVDTPIKNSKETNNQLAVNLVA